MQSVALYDYLFVEIGGKGISLSGNLRYIPYNETNLVYRAAAAFYQASGIDPEVRIRMHKHIPVQAGMGGGSGNAAGMVEGLNALYGHPLSFEQMYEICRDLGSDVPYFLQSGTVLCEGRGEIMTKLPDLPECWLVLVKDRAGVSTKVAFADIDADPHPPAFVCDEMVQAIKQGDLAGVCARLGNSFLPSVSSRCPSVAQQLRDLREFSPNVCMTGSGSAVFAVFTDKVQAQACHRALFGKYPFVCITRPVNRGTIIIEDKE
jgi:4-diphosphocytidyl-2-C-methyl-D-erythritol kinase